MQVLKSFLIAFSLYSRVPVPQFQWEEEDMRYVFCFFPWVGALIAVCLYGWLCLCDSCGMGSLCRTMTAAAIPLLITGGFHVDGFLDTMDAVHSYQPKERKLEILRDSHIGAFAVIMFAVYGMVCLGGLSEIERRDLQRIMCSGFFLSRCFSGISAVSFPLAREDGMLYQFADSSRRRIVKGSLYLQSAACVCLMLYWNVFAGLLAAGVAVSLLVCYFYRSRREFGGVTGDTAGCFVVLCEGGIIAAMALFNILAKYK